MTKAILLTGEQIVWADWRDTVPHTPPGNGGETGAGENGGGTYTGQTSQGGRSGDPDPGEGGGGGGSIWPMLLLWAAIFAGMWFLMIRPQRKREKKMREMQAAITLGDNIVTSGGLFGKVADVGEDCFIVEFGTNRGIRMPVLKSDVVSIRTPKMTPQAKDAPPVNETPKVEEKDSKEKGSKEKGSKEKGSKEKDPPAKDETSK